MTWEIITGDCLEVMRDMADGSVDAVVTDPPYGVDFRGNEWDASIPPWLDPARRVATSVAFTTPPTTMWAYPEPTWVGCWYRPASNSRNMLRGLCHWTPVMFYGKHKIGCDVINIHAMSWGRNQEEHGHHPTPKPVRLMEWLVMGAADHGGTILDPFCGSGTTGVACIRTGRNFIGIEINHEYADIARRRCAEAERQGDLFVAKPTTVKTEQLEIGT